MPSPNVEARMPGARWFHHLRNPILRVGIQTGVYISMVMVAAVLLANRAPWMDSYANERNWIARVIFVLAMLVPVAVLWRYAVHLIAAGMLGWTLATITYVSLGFFFGDFFNRLRTPGQFFMLGAMAYGVAAVACWVAGLVAGARSHHHEALASASRRHIS